MKQFSIEATFPSSSSLELQEAKRTQGEQGMNVLRVGQGNRCYEFMQHTEGFVGYNHICCEDCKASKMLGLPKEHSNNNAARDAYLEFNFYDGVMVDCNDMDRSWNSLSAFSDDLSKVSAAAVNTTRETEGENVDADSDWSCLLREACQERMPKSIASPNTKQRMPKIIASPSRKPCMSALGIYMCDCEEDSVYCNLVTCTMSPSNGKNGKLNRASQEKVVPDDVEIKDSDCRNCGDASRQKQGNLHCVRNETSSSSSKGYGHNGRDSESEFGKRSAIAAWAAVVSDPPCCSSMPTTGLVETIRAIKGSRSVGSKERVPTFASHLELTGRAFIQGNLCSDYVDDFGMCIAQQSAPRQASVIASTLKRHFEGLKLDLGSLSISEPAPYGTLHGVLHCTLKDGLPNYTFLLDDYEEVLTAKIWLEDVRLEQHHEIWKYSFYSSREEKKRKGKSGWKNWRRKDKLNATLVGKMKVSSVLCSEGRHAFSVKSECILLSPRLNEFAGLEEANVITQGRSEMETSDSALYMSPSVATASCQSSSPTKPTGADIAHRNRQTTQICCRNPTIQRTDTQALPDNLLNSSSHRHSELAAMIIDVPLPLQMQDRRVMIRQKHPEVSITTILPSGNHGRPLCDLKGPSPLISRWKEGGKCDCKGWDLGCGLMVLSNTRKKAENGGGSESSKLQRLDCEDEIRPLRLYKQDTDQEEAYFSLAPQASGLVALDFRAPLSPLQALAIAVATLHGRDSSVPNRTHTVCTNSPGLLEETFVNQMCVKDEKGLCLEKAISKKSQAERAVNSRLHQTWQPQVAISNSFVEAHASKLTLSFERV